ncbi:MAG: hypothetical protein ACE37H_08605 [Phycisphaeraceae bacterium]
MDATQTLEQWFQRADDSLPVLTETARWVVFGLGVLLWLAGGKLIKAACVLGGAMLGMILGGLSIAFVESAGVAVAFMVGLGLLGALGAWLVFRAWVALAMAVALAVAAPAAVLVWQGVPPGQLSQDTEQASRQVEQRYSQFQNQLNDQTKLQVQSLIDQGDAESIQQADRVLREQGEEAYQAAREAVFRNIDDIEAWWASQESAGVRTIGLAMLIGAGIGFALGFIFPTHAASMQSALVGSVLIVIPGRELLASHVENAGQWMPDTARATLLTIGLITLVGLGVQWTLYLRRDDKQE